MMQGYLCSVRSVLLGISSNATVKNVELNLSGNSLGTGSSQVLEDCLPHAANISMLDLGDNGNCCYIIMLIYILFFVIFWWPASCYWSQIVNIQRTRSILLDLYSSECSS